MRLVSALLFVALTGSITLAEEAKPADPKPEVSKRKVPLRVVRMLPETHQVLLMDKNRGSHVVAEVGQDVDGYFVEEITDEEVTLVAPSGAEVILAAPDMTWRRRVAERRAAAAKGGKAAKTEPAPVDPYADEPADANIEAGEGGVRVASAGDIGPTAAPIVDAGPSELGSDPYANADAGITAFADAVGPSAPADEPAPATTPVTKPATPAKPDPKAEAGGALAAAATGTPAPAATAKADDTQFTVSRRDVDTALADFGATAVTFNAAFVSEGLRIDSIAEGTILSKVGLRKGDVITSIDGKPLRTFDHAADLYARAGTAKQSTIQVMRAGKPTTLRVQIR